MTRTSHRLFAGNRLPTLLLPVLLAACVCSAPASAQDAAKTKITDFRIGFNSSYKAGCWTQVDVTLVGGKELDTGFVSVTLPDTDGVPTTFVSAVDRPVGVTPGGTTHARLVVRPGQTSAATTVRFVSAKGRQIASRKFKSGYETGAGVVQNGLPSTDRLLVAFGSPLGLGELVRTQASGDGENATHVTRLDDPADLPLQWYGYEGVDTVLLTTSDPTPYRSLASSSSRLAALRRWVELGGRAVLFCGSEAEELIGPGGPLESFAPGNFAGMAPLRESLKIELFADAEESIARGRIDLRFPQLDEVQGRVLASVGNEQNELPIAVRTRVGLGEITFVGLDPDAPPLANWSGRTGLLRKTLDWPAAEPNPQQQNNNFNNYAVPDLVNQLRSTLDGKFEGVAPVSFGIVALLVLLYIALIGPGDYLLVKRVLKRMELTWVTFPLCVALVSYGAYWLANYLKGDELRVNQVEIVDVDLESGEARGTVWTHFFSPRVSNYQLTLQPHFDGKPVEGESSSLTAWLGSPGYGLGGMQAGATQTTMFDRGYAFSPQLDRIEGLPVQEWSTKTLTDRWVAQVDQPLTASLHLDNDELVLGEITNNLDVDLQECVLFSGPWAYRLSTLASGATTTIDLSSEQRAVKTILTSAQAGDATANKILEDGTVPYDPWMQDVARTVKLMMFYEAAGGSKYANTSNGYQHFVDMSRLLKGDQAILLARVYHPPEDAEHGSQGHGSQWFDKDQPLRSDKDRDWTFYRFVIPVKQRAVLGP